MRLMWPMMMVVTRLLCLFFVVGSTYAARPVSEQGDADKLETGRSLYDARCASCHSQGLAGAPLASSIATLSRSQIEAAMTDGVMRVQSAGLNKDQIERIAEYLSASDKQVADESVSGAVATLETQCEGELDLTSAPLWNRWGNDLRNTRQQVADHSSINESNVKSLTLAWTFAFPNAVRARSQPAVTPDVIYTGSQDGTVYALDTQTGCVWWTYKASAEVRSVITIETDAQGMPSTLYFGDFEANVYALRAEDGALVWKKSVRDHPNGTITGSPTLYQNTLYVPMSSLEVISAYYDDYECCHFRGGVTALNAATGETVWRMYTVDQPQKQGRNSAGLSMWGPSGAPIWSTPTVDKKRGLLYVGTGENYSSPATDKSDAIIALRLLDGKVEWVQQTTANDAWNGACTAKTDKLNCPEEDGPDFDFGAPPILTTVSGRDLILAGQKSGMVYALDPEDDGRVVWQQRVGMGGFNGGIHWGMAIDGKSLFVPIADTPGHQQTTGEPRPGLHAFDVFTGKPLWSTLHPAKCDNDRTCYFEGLSAAVTASNGLIFAGALNGRLAAYSQNDGSILWRTETNTRFDPVNKVAGHGGSIDSAGPVIANDMLIVNSGYDKWGQLPGNVLLVFKLKPNK